MSTKTQNNYNFNSAPREGVGVGVGLHVCAQGPVVSEFIHGWTTVFQCV